MLPDRWGPATNWGMFGYEGTVVDNAIKKDALDDLKECVKRGYIDATTEVMGACSVVDFCAKSKASKCEAWLRSQGWQ